MGHDFQSYRKLDSLKTVSPQHQLSPKRSGTIPFPFWWKVGAGARCLAL